MADPNNKQATPLGEEKKKKKRKKRRPALPYGVGIIIAFTILFLAYNAFVENLDAIKGETPITVKTLDDTGRGFVIYDTDGGYYWVDEKSFNSVTVGDEIVLYKGQYGWQVKKPQKKRLDSLFEQRR